jgi:hypothetical protein
MPGDESILVVEEDAIAEEACLREGVAALRALGGFYFREALLWKVISLR